MRRRKNNQLTIDYLADTLGLSHLEIINEDQFFVKVNSQAIFDICKRLDELKIKYKIENDSGEFSDDDDDSDPRCIVVSHYDDLLSVLTLTQSIEAKMLNEYRNNMSNHKQSRRKKTKMAKVKS